jgi:hypothetical protein
MLFKKENEIKRYEVQNGKVLCTIKIGDKWVSNPTLEMFLQQGWQEYIQPTPPAPQPYVPTYSELVEQKVAERYTIQQEMAILRQRNTKPDEFDKYFRYVDQCKEEARQELNLN